MNKKNSTSIYVPVILTICVVIVAWYLIAPGYMDAKYEKQELENEVISLNERLSWLKDADSRLESSSSTFDKLLISVPSEDMDEPNAIAELEAIALKHNLSIPAIAFSGYSDSGDEDVDQTYVPADRVSITMSLEGGFEELSSFIADLEKSVKFMNIRSFTFSDNGETKSLSVDIEAFAQTSPDDASEAFEYEEGI